MSSNPFSSAVRSPRPYFSGVLEDEEATVLFADGVDVTVLADRFEVHPEHYVFFLEGEITAVFERGAPGFLGVVAGPADDDEDCAECKAEEAEDEAVDPLEWFSGLFVDEPIPYTLNGADWRNPEAYR